MRPSISVIIPLAPKETHWPTVVAQLAGLPDNCEVLLAITQDSDEPDVASFKNEMNIRVLHGSTGRAQLMNAAAMASEKEYLWFLHADSSLSENTVTNLLKKLEGKERVLYFHDLVFVGDGPHLMKLNSVGVWFRSHVLKMPFGDQGFCLAQELFSEIGGYPENVPYGEDHVLVWRALQNGVSVKSVGSTIGTSARKYAENGWLKTTMLHLYLWTKQALPELFILLKSKLK